MKCPRCSLRLVRTQISTVNVHQCSKCFGNLILPDRLNLIAAAMERTVQELMDRWRSYPPKDTTAKCRCPECRSVMEKHSKRGGVKFEHDLCLPCNWIWLDSGEIELYQLAYMVSDKGKEAMRFKELHANMPPAQREELERMINRLPDDVGEGFELPYGSSGILPDFL